MQNIRHVLAGISLTLSVILPLSSCTHLNAQEQQRYSSRVYAIPYERVFNAVQSRIEQYPMGLGKADPEHGIVQSRIGGTTPGFGANVGYQVLVSVQPEGQRTRVTPRWEMNVSSEPTKAQLLPVTIDERPLFYVEFFDELDERLKQ